MNEPVNYDLVAPEYDRRYERHRYEGVRACLRRFLGDRRGAAVAEVGCGTGHWLADLSDRGFSRLAGVDFSRRMIEQAHIAAPAALLVRGTATHLPWADDSFDRVFCVNALHHFPDPSAFIFECRRVLRSGGGVLTIGLDPHTGADHWWVYDFFPAALQADRRRYPSTATIRDWLRTAGFRELVTEVAQHSSSQTSFRVAQREGRLDRRSTSQLMVISDQDYAAGMTRIVAEQPLLRADLRLYATTARL
jgi:ubiquinone/menaquinone biosynthesis C-methylase UbiE